jgi:hypothetical protein
MVYRTYTIHFKSPSANTKKILFIISQFSDLINKKLRYNTLYEFYKI